MSKTTISAHKLNRLKSVLEHENDIGIVINSLLEEAMNIMKSDFASLQIYDSLNKSLLMLGHKNFTPDSARFWRVVFPGTGSTCSAALNGNLRVLVEDVNATVFMEDTADLRCYNHSGIASVQSTQLISSKGELVGMMSTHWRCTHEFKDDNFLAFDQLAELATNFLLKRRDDSLNYINRIFTD